MREEEFQEVSVEKILTQEEWRGILGKVPAEIREAALLLEDSEARFLVAAYYIEQGNRIRSNAQARELVKRGEPTVLVDWLAYNAGIRENHIKSLLLAYANTKDICQWAMSICGIGPVIAAGLNAHIDITRCETAGQLWSYAGLNPEAQWQKGEKRPWNPEVKRLAFLLGESFVKVQNNDKDIYGKMYAERKVMEISRNEALKFSAQAEKKAAQVRKSTEAYKYYSIGKLPPAHIHARARRYAAKMFLSHYHHVAYLLHYGVRPPFPFGVEQDGHMHEVLPPNLDMFGLAA